MMNSTALNQRINKFMDAKHQQMPDIRDKGVDELLRDLIEDER